MQRRLDAISDLKPIRLIERPEYKRRWNTPAWEDLERAALRDWLLDHLEDPRLWSASAQMSAGDGYGVDDLDAQFIGQQAQLVLVETLEVGGRLNGIEQGGLRVVWQAQCFRQ